MKRKIFIITIIILIPVFFLGCTIKFGSITINNFTVAMKKPNKYYYTNDLIKNLILDSKISVKLLDTNFYKEKELSMDDIDTVKSFATTLKKANFIEKPKELPNKPAYKLFFNLDNKKYIINIYNEKYISVYPWDGTYSMDYIDMNGIQNLYNLYGLCKYLIPR